MAPAVTTPVQPRRAVALMYHALGDVRPQDMDAHYTVALPTFLSQLQRMAQAGGAGCVRDWVDGSARHRVLLTFDDGHASDYRLAFPALAERRMRADFFVNPARVGKPGYATWAQLREMSAAGMSIQSHGYDHTYLTALYPESLHESLRAARRRIEDQVGAPVTLLAPPGGRMPPRMVDVALRCGYRHVLSSRPGRIAADSRRACILPRMAVTASLGEQRLQHWIEGRALPMARERTRYALLAMAKRVLGDARYERARSGALAARRSG